MPVFDLSSFVRSKGFFSPLFLLRKLVNDPLIGLVQTWP